MEPERREIISAWLVLSQGQGVGRLGVRLLTTFEMQEVFTGAEEILGMAGDGVAEHLLCATFWVK